MGYIYPFERRLRQRVTRLKWRWHHKSLNPLPIMLVLFALSLTYTLLQLEPALPSFKQQQAPEVAGASPYDDGYNEGYDDEDIPAHKRRQQQIVATVSFDKCGGRYNCVVDGDTFYWQDTRIRIADIDAPETHPSRCAHEAKLGKKATDRMLELLNEGPFTMLPVEGRDQDQYGRKLRTVVRQGRSLGDILVSEGLARRWSGHRQPWCV